MGERGENIFLFSISTADRANEVSFGNWKIKEGDYDMCDTDSTTSSSEDSTSGSSFGSTSSSDILDDVSSPLSPLLPNGPMNQFSDLMNQFPIKRGLSKYFQGKSQSFACISSARCIEDLAKKVTPHRKRSHKSLYTPKPAISKKAARSSNSCPSLLGKRKCSGASSPTLYGNF
ncbi:hypothetical protein L1049_018144 [Liquidambar formosana]|uniref:Oxidative stress 3 n=1 Tax=Liquidambar formosana TaxID=63359 RepID=A0AAP0NL75_LIQFO